MDVFSQYFRPVPSNPHYYFYCPLSSKKDVSPQFVLLSSIQKIRNKISTWKMKWCNIHSKIMKPMIVHTCLSWQEDSEDGEMSRRATEEMLMETEPSTEDGEQHYLLTEAERLLLHWTGLLTRII